MLLQPAIPAKIIACKNFYSRPLKESIGCCLSLFTLRISISYCSIFRAILFDWRRTSWGTRAYWMSRSSVCRWTIQGKFSVLFRFNVRNFCSNFLTFICIVLIENLLSLPSLRILVTKYVCLISLNWSFDM